MIILKNEQKKIKTRLEFVKIRMKINKFNESIEDELYYEGDIHFHFNVPYNNIESYSNIFSYNAVDSLTKIELGKNENIIKDINYKLIDKDDTITNQDIIDGKNNFNL